MLLETRGWRCLGKIANLSFPRHMKLVHFCVWWAFSLPPGDASAQRTPLYMCWLHISNFYYSEHIWSGHIVFASDFPDRRSKYKGMGSFLYPCTGFCAVLTVSSWLAVYVYPVLVGFARRQALNEALYFSFQLSETLLTFILSLYTYVLCWSWERVLGDGQDAGGNASEWEAWNLCS